jgi:hypothetical protein
LLKTAIAEFDTSKTVDVKGPMLDPILKWDGQGEVPIYKDAASILERYYFNESADKGVEVAEMEYNEDGTEASTPAEKHGEGTGTEQAGTSEKGSIPAEKKEIEKDLAKEGKASKGKGKAVSEKEFNGKSAVKPKKYVDEQDEEMEDDAAAEDDAEEEVTESLENAVIEKLIAEMEEENDDDEDEAEVETESEVMNYTGDGVKPGMEAPDEKEASGPEQDAQGAGTQQAGTGIDAGQVPDRNDHADEFVKPKNYNEQEEAGGEEDPADLDVDVEVKGGEEVKEASAVPGGPSPGKAKGKKDNEDDVYEEAFQIFKEAIEEEDEEDEEEDEDK